MKNWNNAITQDSWRILKYNAETITGFEKLLEVGPSISIFGSARTKPNNKYYKSAEEIGYLLTQKGYGVITGGGPGIMEAANKGAKENNGKSVGLCIELPFEENSNKFIDKDKKINFDYFFVRKVMFVRYAQGFIVMPGGFGTLDELFEALTLIQTNKVEMFPIILVGSEYWKGLIKWIKNTLLEENSNVSSKDLDLFRIVDTKDEIISILEEFHNNYEFSPNF